MTPLRAYVLDDELLAVKRLARLLAETGRVVVAGSNTDPVDAVAELENLPVDLLFLDIEMPELNGFDVLARLPRQPLVVFTTAYDRYALKAFDVNSIDYLLKPIERQHLERALSKIERIRGGSEPRPEWLALMGQLTATFQSPVTRLPSRVGERIEFVDLARVSHFFAQDKLTYAATEAKNHSVDYTITELEQKLDPRKFLRIHRSTLLNLDYVQELHGWFAGRVVVRLKDEKRTELVVARDRVAALKERLGL